MQLNLGALSELYQLLREADTFAVHYSKEAWDMSQDMATREGERNLPRIPMSLPLSETESQQMQKAYLLFDACRHTLCFSTSYLQDYVPGAHITSYPLQIHLPR
jgi:hypothetical protein